MSAVPVLGTIENPGPQNPESKAQTNLIVNYLPQSVTEEEFRVLFSTFGIVQSCKLIKDKISGISLGYGFINYGSCSEADKAIQALNGLPIQSKTIKVSYARPSSSAIKNANLYIANLPKEFSQNELEAMFRPFGTIITSKILLDTQNGLGKGVGFVRFDKFAEAENAIAALNGKQLSGMTGALTVKFANPPKANNSVGSSASVPTLPHAIKRQSNIYGGNIGPMRHAMTSMRFNPVSHLGGIGSGLGATGLGAAGLGAAGIGASLGTATLGTGGLAPAALAGTSLSSNLPGLNPTTGNWCIFVYNLPETAQDSLLYQLFGPFGAIMSVNIIRDISTGKCKRFGFVNMANYDEAYSAVVALNGYVLEGKPLQVSFKSQKPK